MKKPFKLFEKDGQQILVSAICTTDEVCVRYSMGFDDLTVDMNVGFENTDEGEEKMVKAFNSVTEKSALEIMETIKSMMK
jgi:hypothetical protein